MGFFSNVFGRKSGPVAIAPEGKGMRAADLAIREARAGRITVPQMLRSVLAAQVVVPLADPPVNDGKSFKWKPATITKQADGVQFLVAFTNETNLTAFSGSVPEYSFAFVLDAAGLLDLLPPWHGQHDGGCPEFRPGSARSARSRRRLQ